MFKGLNGNCTPAGFPDHLLMHMNTIYDQFNGSLLARGYELTNYQLLVNRVKL